VREKSLRSLVKASGKSLRQISRDTGVSPMTLSRIAKGSKPNALVTKTLRDYFSIAPCCERWRKEAEFWKRNSAELSRIIKKGSL